MATPTSWPQPREYLEAVQTPRLCFSNPRLRGASIHLNHFGMPVSSAGKSAIVFKATADGKDVAIRCFTRAASDQRMRYLALDKHLDPRPSYLVGFGYRDDEIKVGTTRYPLVEMDWVDGDPLDVWVGQHLGRNGDLGVQAEAWRDLVADMQRRKMAHGGIDNDNCMISGSQLKLVDYDGCYIPSLRDKNPGESGAQHFQHPHRRGYYADNMDAFPSLVVYLSMTALHADPSLWQRYHKDNNLIFSAYDYRAPRATPIWRDLASNPDPAVRRLTAALADMCDAPVDSLPPLSQVVGKVSGSYDAEISRSRPGCLLLLVDQSDSMKHAFAGSPTIRKADAAADTINKLLMDIVIRCTQNFGEGPRNYFDVGVIGYGVKSVGPRLGGPLRSRNLVSISELAVNVLRVEERSKQIPDGAGGLIETTVKFPIWLDPAAEDRALMREAIDLASTVLKSWVAEHPASYPPIVLNISSGEADSDPLEAAQKLTAISTTDGPVLLFNVHLSSST